MKLGVMPGDTIPAPELKSEGFDAVQLFWGMGEDAASKDPSVESIEATLQAGDLALTAMTLHIDLVGPLGVIESEVERTVHCVQRTAALEGRFGDTPQPILVWHPSGYPSGDGLDDVAVFEGLCSALTTVCAAAEKHGVHVAVEITRAPRCLAIWMAKPATPPAPPWTRMVSPDLSSRVSSTEISAVSPMRASAAMS